jgi:hypothetical protein
MDHKFVREKLVAVGYLVSGSLLAFRPRDEETAAGLGLLSSFSHLYKNQKYYYNELC